MEGTGARGKCDLLWVIDMYFEEMYETSACVEMGVEWMCDTSCDEILMGLYGTFVAMRL